VSPEPIQDLLRSLYRHAIDQADQLQPALQRMMDTSVAGSPADLDYKTTARSVRSQDREELWRRIQINYLHSSAHVHDHVRALALLIADPAAGVPIYAHQTVARAALESSVNLAHVLDPDEAFELRFARGVAFLLSDSDAEVRTAKKVPPNAHMEAPGPRVSSVAATT
jgi:hypothetical protein